ncbi:unnamed protein product [Candidula unifasciata]|uniref:Uncharacterized protein n=1 Tax=Candidula unifasciata TaxID=100452 RepID=A0A8S4A0P5_9EUPU|nr:unnamed protein product [Candidula unifasciata]
MRLPQSSILSQLNALVALAALILFIVAFATNYWLEKYFLFPINVADIATIPVNVNMGLFTACRLEHYRNNHTTETCSPEGAAVWQKISAGLNVAALVFAFVGTLVAFLAVTLEKLANGLRAKLGIIVCYVLTCGFSVGPLVMFPINRRIQVKPNMSPFQVDFDLGWSYTVAVVSTGIFAVLVLLNTIDIVWLPNGNGENKSEDRHVLRADVYSVSTGSS